MNTLNSLQDIARAIHNLIHPRTVTDMTSISMKGVTVAWIAGKQKGLASFQAKPLFYLVAPAGLEPATKRL
ncbi:hypothetical protein F384_24670 [Citrobacter amalonaticus Y19]|uniref:Uncharacterized protein n=1 Tax=Citrobacter amalonaticus Y19 TaxID=1261127 RepID=A0A0F6TZD0_CITAM|nr:hypothetical protein F384_24670 [Citrobacter amalonaticus Y19]